MVSVSLIKELALHLGKTNCVLEIFIIGGVIFLCGYVKLKFNFIDIQLSQIREQIDEKIQLLTELVRK